VGLNIHGLVRQLHLAGVIGLEQSTQGVDGHFQFRADTQEDGADRFDEAIAI